MSKCRCIRPATAAENRAIDAQLRAMDPAARRRYENELHKAFLATKAACRAEHGTTSENGGCLPVVMLGAAGVSALAGVVRLVGEVIA